MITLRAGQSLIAGMALAGLNPRALWEEYFALTGSHTPGQLLAYLNGDTSWTALEHNIAAQALNEHCATMGLGYPVAYAHELETASSDSPTSSQSSIEADRRSRESLTAAHSQLHSSKLIEGSYSPPP